MLKTVEELYANHKYEEALKLILDHKGQISEGLWHFNLGTIYGKLENYPLARFHFLMAADKGFNSKELYTNKDLVESKLDIHKFETPISATDYLIKGSLFASQGIFTIISLVFVICAALSAWKRAQVKVTGVFFGLALFFLGTNLWVLSWNKKIITETQTIQEGPSGIFRSTGELPIGVMVIGESKEEWVEIIYPSRFKGWIRNFGFKELK